MVGAGLVDPVFVGNDLPELGSDLVTALAYASAARSKAHENTGLNVDDFAHVDE